LPQDIPDFGPYHEILQGPFQRFKDSLYYSSLLTQKSKIMKSAQIVESKETQTQVLQQQLNLIKDAYDLTISSFFHYLKRLNSQVSFIDNQASDLNELEVVINTALVQIRSIRSKIPQSFSPYLCATFEGMKRDFSEFKKSIPDKLYYRVSPFIEKFDKILDLDQINEKGTPYEKSITVQQNKRNSHKKKGQEASKTSPSSLATSYESIKKSMFECLQDAQNKKNNKSTISSSKKSKLSDNIKAADEKFRSVPKGRLSRMELSDFLAVSENIYDDWRSVGAQIPKIYWDPLKRDYYDFEEKLLNFKKKVGSELLSFN